MMTMITTVTEMIIFEIQCPNCGEDVMIDFDMIDDVTLSYVRTVTKKSNLSLVAL